MEAMELSKLDDGQAQLQIMVHENKYHYWFAYILQDIDETNFHQFLSEFGQRCEDRFVQDWRASLENEGTVAETNSGNLSNPLKATVY